MRTLITISFVTMLLFITVFFASAAIDPNMILYFAFDEQLDGKMVEDLTGGGNNGKLKLGAKNHKRTCRDIQRHGGVKNF